VDGEIMVMVAVRRHGWEVVDDLVVVNFYTRL
jgi:hypothetical protein